MGKKMTAPREIADLVERFDRNREAYQSGKYNETQLRREFIDPFFKALGWDVDNTAGHAEAYKDVIHEDAIKVGSATKAPDYSFRIGGTRKFFVEAKKPSVNIAEDIGPAYQLRRYAWSAKLPLSILTDFEEFAVYDCRIKPDKGDRASTARIIYLTDRDYLARWEEIAAIFSKEAVLKGSFDKYADSARLKKGTAGVDAAFLREIETWREMLARNIALRNPHLTQREINTAVTVTINRIIFLRICEDRGIETYGQLMALQNGTQIYERLVKIYYTADDKYNSGLFHFRKEKDRPASPDTLTLNLSIDDKTLKDIFRSLYYPESPYEFSVLPADILGQVYEQFLGKVIHLTTGHRAKVEYKPEVKKAGGVYYTPTYIVEYIVRNTVGKLLPSSDPGGVPSSVPNRKAITPRQAAGIRILDPACGSGSFLLGAYQYLLNWHLVWYAGNEPEKWIRGKSPVLCQGPGGDWRLTTTERKRILLNNIYGVDIDPQAVEMTKLSLLLKVLEGENGQTLSSQLRLFHERALPDLGNNIKCGNSLIGPDFYDNQQLGFFDDEERYRINCFDWEKEFPDIFRDGGFDAVVGNPPWGAEFNQEEKIYFRNKYDDFHIRTPESFNYFVGKMWRLTNKGLVGVIIPSSFLNQHEFLKTRKYIIDNAKVSRICNMGNGVFEKVTAPSCIIIFGAKNKLDPSLFFDFRKNDRKSLPSLLKQEDMGRDASSVGKDSEGYILQIRSDLSLIEKCYKWPALRDIAEEVATGVSSGLDKAYVYANDQLQTLNIESGLLKKLIVGGEICRYWMNPISGKQIIYVTPEVDINKFPNTKSVLLPYREQLKLRREAANGKIPWFSLNWPRRKKLFDQPKILIRQTADHIMACFDADEWYCLKSGIIVQLPSNATINYEYLLGILNSRLIRNLYDDLVGEQARVFPEVKPVQLFKLPIRTINFSDSADKARHDRMVALVEQMLSLHKKLAEAKADHDKTILQRQIDATDRQIDRLVYELYELTEEEIRIVEGTN
jgi:hypothetical protein